MRNRHPPPDKGQKGGQPPPRVPQLPPPRFRLRLPPPATMTYLRPYRYQRGPPPHHGEPMGQPPTPRVPPPVRPPRRSFSRHSSNDDDAGKSLPAKKRLFSGESDASGNVGPGPGSVKKLVVRLRGRPISDSSEHQSNENPRHIAVGPPQGMATMMVKKKITDLRPSQIDWRQLRPPPEPQLQPSSCGSGDVGPGPEPRKKLTIRLRLQPLSGGAPPRSHPPFHLRDPPAHRGPRQHRTVPWLSPQQNTFLCLPRVRGPPVPRGQPMGPPPPRVGPPDQPGQHPVGRGCLPVKKRYFAAGGGSDGGRDGDGDEDEEDEDMQPPEPFEWPE